MVNFACGLNQSETGKYFEWIINKNLYLPPAVFIAQLLATQSKQLKQIFQIKHNIAKNPNWLETDQLAIYN